MLKKLANYFNVSVDYLIGYSNNPLNFSPSDMTKEETYVIKDFHRLDAKQKALVQAYIQGLLQE